MEDLQDTHRLFKKYFLELTSIFEKNLGKPDNKKLPFQKKEHEWLNCFYCSPVLRHSHLEFYNTNKICVLHVNVFPDPKIDIPILGFDMISINNRVTGLFFDYTPTFTSYSKLDYDLDFLKTNFKSQKRPLPEWANFFSKNFYCVEPLFDELDSIWSFISTSIEKYFDIHRDEILKLELRTEKQNLYCQGQKRNDKTFKALKAEIGEKDTKLFLDKYLFPEIN